MKIKKSQFLHLIHRSKTHSKLVFFLTIVVSLTFHNTWSQKGSEIGLPHIQNYSPVDYGLPDNIGKPYLIQGQFYLASDDQAYKFDAKDQKFINDKELFIKFGLNNQKAKINYIDDNSQVGLLTYDGEKRLNQMLAAPKKDGSYSLLSLEEQRIIDMKKFGVFSEFNDSILWFKGMRGVIRHDLKKKIAANSIRSEAIISKVFYQNDLLLFSGYSSRPWYDTWWAYLIYVIGAFVIFFLLLIWWGKELQRKNQYLENLVTERTTEIRHKNELLNHQTEQLVQLNDSKTRLYSNITHEFRTPLTVILGMAETLKTNVLNKSFEGADTSLEMIRRNGKNLLHLVNEMLDLAKVESGSMELNLVQTDAIPFVKYLSESFHSLAEAKKINLTIYSEVDTLEMDIDVNKMASIISNLLSNAIKFTSANGKIIVHLNKTETNDTKLFSIKVQDNGLGLAEDDIAHLFDRFYQVDNESESRQEGTGIGLSLAKEFVELMNGTIDVESTLGKGSTFTIQIPITNNAVKTVDAKITVEPPIKKTAPSAKTEPSILDESTTLPLALIIEDNFDVAHYLKTCLQGKYEILHAADGIIGIETAFEKVPDIVICDVMMPGKDGYEVCDTLKADERTDHIPIIMLTAKVTVEDRITGLSHGADAYLAKPFNKVELFTRLNQLILLRKKMIQKFEQDGFGQFLKVRAENPEAKFLKRTVEIIHEEMSDHSFGSRHLARKLLLSESQIYRKLKAITGKSTAIFIRSVRLQRAKELIQTTKSTISEIAYDVGFNDPSWFSRAFKEEFGFSPSELSK